MKNEDLAAIILGGAFIAISFTLAPSAHHHMMMGSYYLGILPSALAIVGLLLIFIPIIKSGVLESKFEKEGERNSREKELQLIREKSLSKNDKKEVVERVLEEDERTVFRIVAENEGITQDSLHFRTGFSQSKISMVVKKLEEKNLIYRERFGKTFKIYLSDWLKEEGN